jgi:hypothetical protein
MAAAHAYAAGLDGMELLRVADPAEHLVLRAVISAAAELRAQEREAQAVVTANAVGRMLGGG